ISAGFTGDHARARALTPDLQLLDGGSAERVAGGERDRLAFTAKLGCKLADRRRLAGTVDADNQDDMWPVSAVEDERLGHWREHLGDLGGKHRLHLLLADLLVEAAFTQPVD